MTTDRDDIASLIERVKAATTVGDITLAKDFAALVLQGEWRPWRAKARTEWLYATGTDKVVLYGHDEAVRWFQSIDAAFALVERLKPGGWWLILEDATDRLWNSTGREDGLKLLPIYILTSLLTSIKENHP